MRAVNMFAYLWLLHCYMIVAKGKLVICKSEFDDLNAAVKATHSFS